MNLQTIGFAVLIAIIVIGLIEIRRVVVALNKDMRAILYGQQEVKRRLDLLERERRK